MPELPGFERPAELSELIMAASILVGAPMAGWLIQRIVLGRLKNQLATAQWGVGDVVSRAVHNMVIAVATLVGIYVAIGVLPLIQRVDAGLQRLVIAVLIIFLSVAVMRATTDTIKLYALRTGRPTQSSSIFVNLARIFIITVALLFLLQASGVPIAPLLGALGVAGLAIALAAQETLSNFFAGVQLVATKKVKAGDYIELESGEEGYVVDIDWRHTSVRALRDNMILIPNSQLMNAIVTNYNYPYEQLSMVVPVGVSYSSDLEHVQRVTLEVATEVQKEVEGAVEDFEPSMRFHTFGDSSIDISVIIRVKEFVEQFPVRHEFVKRLHKRYNEEGIVIPFPIRTIDWPDGPKARQDG